MFAKIISIVVVVSAVFQPCAHSANPFLHSKPDFVKTCKFADKDFVECSRISVQGMFDKLEEGIPEIGIMPMDPLKITSIQIAQGEGPVNLDVMMNNITITGFRDSVVESNLVDPKTYQFNTKIHIPKLKIEGVYKADGRILIVPIRGQGNSWFDCGDLDIDVTCDVGLRKKKNHYFYDVKATHVNFDLKKMKLRLDNLFDGAKDLEQGTNEYLNANWREVYEAIRPVLSQTIEEILLSILKQFFIYVPADYFISDIK